MGDIFPGLLEQYDFVDDSYSEAELRRKDYSELQAIAAEHPSDEIHGRMGKEELIDGLEGLERVE